ncbi:SAM-dependent methyltransferase [bacterium (Candidatus Blackallbacteria) CG17_big_fil_post_rev_8_21_14_2_50_48_46]|uniref:SAM-dependent methyltransferase n=1 Tax=bacterium (Candidatus Blackallbacteria) CG17_big_fil_post_rev_8_21_14_2_50_48_46 TaxID=2014261 RepID=A0A2M7FZ34_9BACT|nr:MAG: SAM-dependent methyltransferase [bacterium (Candidatus Blackallbacteria) CG18_big_fil_WC_8_21_14_2_50_49_26]PIW14607.1 MAG: SAM-dependent methyltransferase [bacterium (Candidatus Blackallbacteria) CG17_big_fil_post_rev_8_21_14_2_50_48_46]PIW45658.1 MAG: SAM-dependent methyltransferase [bacterium (Candidatus Blackallbacteria) CG13_big_fil_rev_8_21_14_2_50_49_14]
MPSDLRSALEIALQKRRDLFAFLEKDQTDCYRLFSGSNEGAPGLTVDRYGPQLLIQTFHQGLSPEQLATIEMVSATHFEVQEVVYNDRSAPHSRRQDPVAETNPLTCREMGVRYRVQGKHAGQDPLLFLDLRVGRRYVREYAAGLEVLNLFAYTCGLGLCATMGGAREVWNVDFAARNLAVGRENARLNHLPAENLHFVQSDFFTAVKQWAGLPVSFRRQKGQKPRSYLHFEPRQFDFVCLDPPRWAKSPFGTVDLVRDYPSVFKPALLATRSGGTLLCTNNVADVSREAWEAVLWRCAEKAGRPLASLEWLLPEADFPSRDGQPPLKIALMKVA